MKRCFIVLVLFFVVVGVVGAVEDEEIRIVFPENGDYDQSRIELIVEADELCDLMYTDKFYTLDDFYQEIEITDPGTGPLDLPIPTFERSYSLCMNCDGYSRKRQFREGFHEVVVECSDRPGIVDEVLFTVDTRKPRIIRTFPKMNGFTNGDNFLVKYSEDMLVGVKLRINEVVDYLQVPPYAFFNSGATCPYGRNQECAFRNIDLSEFDGEEIEFEYIVSDYGGRQVHSRKSVVRVDLTEPVLLNPDSFWEQGEGRRNRFVEFRFEIEEENFDEIIFVDLEETGRRERRLCSRLRDGVCEVKRGFSNGSHKLEIKIKDKAGNFVEEFVEFEVV
jgi:hypothetical protein